MLVIYLKDVYNRLLYMLYTISWYWPLRPPHIQILAPPLHTNKELTSVHASHLEGGILNT